jgi:peptide/nickel transport system permease protein
MRIVDAILALPWILKMLLIIVTFGTGIALPDQTLARIRALAARLG